MHSDAQGLGCWPGLRPLLQPAACSLHMTIFSCRPSFWQALFKQSAGQILGAISTTSFVQLGTGYLCRGAGRVASSRVALQQGVGCLTGPLLGAASQQLLAAPPEQAAGC